MHQCPDCPAKLKTGRGLTQHRNAKHRDISPASAEEDDLSTCSYRWHALLNGRPCDENGHFLPQGQPPPPAETVSVVIADGASPWAPFGSRIEFDQAHFHFVELQSSEAEIDKALDMWAASVSEFGGEVPWQNAQELYHTIDEIQHGDAPWKVYRIRYNGPLPRGTPPKWMTETYELCARNSQQVVHNQLSTPGFKDTINYVPYQQFNKQADLIAKDPATHGSFFVPIVAGSDKTTVSVATGHQEYHPVYMSPGNLTNTARRAHGNSFLPVAFLPIPKTNRRHRKTAAFQKFCRQMYHSALACVFEPLRSGMTTPDVVRCPDGHFRHAVYGLGPYIADYPEQVWLAGIVQGWCPKCNAPPENLDINNAIPRSSTMTDFLVKSFNAGTLWSDFGIRADVIPFTHRFPRADIHELLSPDLLHQVIKGCFKDHLVTWVNEYLVGEFGEAHANAIIDDIDRRISAVPPFPGIRRFPEGRDFLQWTGDDSKALMKVYLPAIAGHVPPGIVKCLSAFLDFCYLARQNAISSQTLAQLDDALARFHDHRKIFIEAGVRQDLISLPRQHALKHYGRSIRLFGSPNGLCSSMTESKHIKAVKEPWRRSNRCNALFQMLTTNCRLDKMAAARQRFASRGMMQGSTYDYTMKVLRGEQPQPPDPNNGSDDDDENDSDTAVLGPKVLSSVELAQTPQRNYSTDLDELAASIEQPRLPELVRRFLFDQLNPDSPLTSSDVPLGNCPRVLSRISVFHSAVARFYAPSDLCGAGGMYREFIRSCPSWRKEYPRRDTVFVCTGSEADPMLGMVIGRVYLFFSFVHSGVYYPCALVHWLVPIGEQPDPHTGLWVVKPEFERNGRRTMGVVHLDSVARAAHLIGACGTSCLPDDFHFSDSLDAFRAFYVNRYADHHMFEFLS
ncbi:hypothetical protein HYDPIDRAFT_30701 [Hydnomerulius pinastri MD-312]|uniref:C2H2-type domain-containing protein n=1 Tax=Hydnomerulius pinastri MD-312 TaxID=994086 RepID=A0A0C9WD35_9AGAM|nr:hypothetical protein HYDPIDRAFT_30701 [Hydnomerulius pinastri MD-312]